MTVDGRVAFIIDELGGGGAQRSAVLTASALHAQGLMTLLVAARAGPYMRDLARGLPLRVIAPSWPSPTAVLRLILGLRRLAASEEVATYVTNGFAPSRIALLMRLLRMLRGASVVIVERNTLSAALADRFPNRFVRSGVWALSYWLYRHADAIIGVSDGVPRDLEETLRLPEGTVTTIYNPVDIDRITAAIEDRVPEALARTFASLPRPVVITTGRLVTRKAHDGLLEAFATLPDTWRGRRGSLVTLGDGPLRDDIERQARELGIDARIWMPGFVDNPWWFMARSDVFVLSSRNEGHPRVLLEALACGLPVISTDCPSGPREILRDVPSARLVPVGDTRAMSHEIATLLDKPRPSRSVDLSAYAPSEVARAYARVLSKVAPSHETRA